MDDLEMNLEGATGADNRALSDVLRGDRSSFSANFMSLDELRISRGVDLQITSRASFEEPPPLPQMIRRAP